MLALLGFLLGLAVGSFLNVVIYRLPRGQSVVRPPSHCPACGARLGPSELVPVVSYLVQGGRCRHCGARISPRYPLVELLTGGLFAAAALLRPVLWPDLVFLWAFLALLVALAFIDADTYLLPDSLTYGGLALGLAAGALGMHGGLVPALRDALLAAGLMVLVGGYGNLVLRRLRDGRPSWPVGFHQVYLAALAGALLGPLGGIALGLLNWALNWATRRGWNLPEPVSLLLLPLAAVLHPAGPLAAGEGALVAAGALALLGGLYWAFLPEPEEDDDEPVALGFGDVKLAGMLGAWASFPAFLVGLFVAVLAGAVLGLLFRRRKLPFGPYLALGGAVAVFFGDAIWRAYLASLGW